MSADQYKRAAAAAAAEYVKDGMILGLGTGSTAAHFVDLVGELVRDGVKVAGVPTSEDTRAKALSVGIEVIEPDEITSIDLAVDGTDEADGRLNLIKGGGGALLREKIVANAAQRFVVIADNSKSVSTLGAFALPVEIAPALFALTVKAVRAALAENGYDEPALNLRTAGDGGVFLTDGGGYVLDCALNRIEDPDALDKALRSIPGVIETGLFIGLADEILFAGPDGLSRIVV